jgi:thioredoxin reductase (NADPH)
LPDYEIAVAGGGLAGLTAALFAARHGRSTILLDPLGLGGALLNTECVEDFPGFPEGVAGFELGPRLQEQAANAGAVFETAEVRRIEPRGRDWVVVTNSGETIAAALIVATGSRPRKLGVPGEDELAGKGVSYCAVCDGAFFQDAEIAVVGGGDSAVEEGTFLTRYGSRVHLIHRRGEYRAQPILIEHMRATGKVEEVLNTVVEEIHGTDGRVSHLALRNVESGERSELRVQAVFPFVGFTPHSDVFDPELAARIEVDDSGHIVTDQAMRTAVPGIFAAGDVRSQFVRQITNAVGDATTAALAANAYVEQLKHERSKQTA